MGNSPSQENKQNSNAQHITQESFQKNGQNGRVIKKVQNKQLKKQQQMESDQNKDYQNAQDITKEAENSADNKIDGKKSSMEQELEYNNTANVNNQNRNQQAEDNKISIQINQANTSSQVKGIDNNDELIEFLDEAGTYNKSPNSLQKGIPYFQITQSNYMNSDILDSTAPHTNNISYNNNTSIFNYNNKRGRNDMSSLDISFESNYNQRDKKLKTSTGSVKIQNNIMNIKLFYQSNKISTNGSKWIYTSADQLKESLKLLNSSKITGSQVSQLLQDLANKSQNANSQVSIARYNMFADIIGSCEEDNQCSILQVEHDLKDKDSEQKYTNIKMKFSNQIVEQYNKQWQSIQEEDAEYEEDESQENKNKQKMQQQAKSLQHQQYQQQNFYQTSQKANSGQKQQNLLSKFHNNTTEFGETHTSNYLNVNNFMTNQTVSTLNHRLNQNLQVSEYQNNNNQNNFIVNNKVNNNNNVAQKMHSDTLQINNNNIFDNNIQYNNSNTYQNSTIQDQQYLQNKLNKCNQSHMINASNYPFNGDVVNSQNYIQNNDKEQDIVQECSDISSYYEDVGYNEMDMIEAEPNLINQYQFGDDYVNGFMGGESSQGN